MGDEEAETYRLWVNEERTMLVRLWSGGGMEVATRSVPGAVWGPPVMLVEER